MSSDAAPSKSRRISALDQLGTHDHLCLIYETRDEQLAVAAPFVRLGLERGERCLCLGDADGLAALVGSLARLGVDVGAAQSAGALKLASERDAYLCEGQFAPAAAVESLAQAEFAALHEGFGALRVLEDMAWVFGEHPSAQQLVEYEALLSQLSTQRTILGMCEFDRGQFDAELLLNVIRSHDRVITGGMVCRSFYYMPFEEILSPERSTAELDRLLSSMQARERAEAELNASLDVIERSKQEWESTVDSLSELVCLLDDAARVIRANRVVEAWGLGQVTEVRGRHVHDLLHPDCSDPTCYLGEFVERTRHRVAKGQVTEHEVVDPVLGRHLHLLVRPVASPLRPKRRHTDSYAVLVVYDITARKQAELALKRSEIQLNSIISSMVDLVFVFDKEGRLSFHRATRDELLAPPEEFMGRKYSEVLPAHLRKTFDEAIAQTQQGKVAECEYALDIRGQTQWYSLKMSPMFIDGEFSGSVAVVRNVTEHRFAERALLAASRMEATATLAGGIAHDFNNLMTAVLGNGELLRGRVAADAEAGEMVNDVIQAAERAAELSLQMLAFARGGKYQPEVMDFNDVVAQVLHLQARAHPDRIDVESRLAPDLWTIKADPTQMRQVVSALYTNAVEAIEQQGRIFVGTRNVDVDATFANAHTGMRPGAYACLTVRDTGCGLSPEALARAFEPFFTTKFQGRGLGLAAAYGIVKNHGGYLAADSQPGKGAVFSVYLPAAEAQVEKPAPPTAQPTTGNERIIVIDDEEVVLQVTGLLLEKQGYEVLYAHNGQEAIDTARNFDGDIHLAILDMDMPVIDGAETFKRLKQARPDIRVIIYSGYDLDDEAQALLDHGASAFLRKPAHMGELGAKVRKALDS